MPKHPRKEPEIFAPRDIIQGIKGPGTDDQHPVWGNHFVVVEVLDGYRGQYVLNVLRKSEKLSKLPLRTTYGDNLYWKKIGEFPASPEWHTLWNSYWEEKKAQQALAEENRLRSHEEDLWWERWRKSVPGYEQDWLRAGYFSTKEPHKQLSGALPEEWRQRVAGWDINGRRILAENIPSVTGTSLKTFRHRVEVDGLPPVDAALMPPHAYKKETEIDRLFRGWSYWCAREGIPVTDEFMILNPQEDARAYGDWVWVHRDKKYYGGGYGPPVMYSSSGARSFCYELKDHYSDARTLMLIWLDVITRHFELEFRDVDGTEAYALLKTSPFRAHHCCSTFLPVTSRDNWVFYIRPFLTKERHRGDIALNNFDLLGLCAHIRKEVRDHAAIWFQQEKVYGAMGFSETCSATDGGTTRTEKTSVSGVPGREREDGHDSGPSATGPTEGFPPHSDSLTPPRDH